MRHFVIYLFLVCLFELNYIYPNVCVIFFIPLT